MMAAREEEEDVAVEEEAIDDVVVPTEIDAMEIEESEVDASP